MLKQCCVYGCGKGAVSGKRSLEYINGVISLIITFNKHYYYTNTIIIAILKKEKKNPNPQRYVINTELHIPYFFNSYLLHSFILWSRGICILAQNKLVQ